jgi:hypothetical protein
MYTQAWKDKQLKTQMEKFSKNVILTNKKTFNRVEKRTYLLVKGFKFPDTFAKIIDLIPPAQANQDATAYILHNPEIKCREKYRHHKYYDKVVHKQCR